MSFFLINRTLSHHCGTLFVGNHAVDAVAGLGGAEALSPGQRTHPGKNYVCCTKLPDVTFAKKLKKHKKAANTIKDIKEQAPISTDKKY
jgi:hypothetical protein